MANSVQVYAFKNYVFSLNGTLIEGFDAGSDVVKVEYGDLVQVKTGADGAKIYIPSADMGFNVTMKIQATAPINAFLRGIANSLQRKGTFPIPLYMNAVDLARRDQFNGSQGIMTNAGTPGLGEDTSAYEWKFHFADGEIYNAIVAPFGGVTGG